MPFVLFAVRAEICQEPVCSETWTEMVLTASSGQAWLQLDVPD